jgi:homoserine O-acetyltransferase
MCLLALPLCAQELKFADLGDFRLENGAVIHDCRVGYRTF